VKSTRELPIVIVAWVDSVLESSHEVDLKDDLSGFGKLLEREDIGFLVRSDRKEVVLAISRCHGDNTVSYSNTIPRGWVKKITYLQEIPEEADAEPKQDT
jgi:hypothetical protein